MSDLRYDNEFCIITENDDAKMAEVLTARVETMQTIEKIQVIDLSVTITGRTTNVIDSVINKLAEGTILELIQLESEPRSNSSDLAVEKLVAEGKTIITVDK